MLELFMLVRLTGNWRLMRTASRREPDESIVNMSVDAAAKMECPLVVELSNYVKEDSRSGIVSCLTRIKTDRKCSERLMENGGVNLLVELLSYRNMKVLDATLSILANACLLSHIREKVKDTKIALYVVWILKNLESGDTLHCRACRLMGNLSESTSHAKSLCDAGAVSALTEALRSRSNAQTLCMAVRAVRNMWSIHEGSREKILKAGSIKAITSLLVRSRKKLMERDNDTKYTELAESCLKAMSVFVDETDPRSGEQMRGGDGIHGYRCIVDYCRANNKTAIKCLYKLCRTAERRPALGNCGAIECLVEAVSNGSSSSRHNSSLSSSSSSSSWESLVSLCLFCREAVNRAKIRSGSGLEAILALLTKIEYERYHPMLLHALGQFMCDDLSIPIMVKNGLVDVLVEKLKIMAKEIKIVEGQERGGRNGKKRSADTSPYRRAAEIKYNRTSSHYGRFSSDYPRVDWSPGSSSTAYSSPPSTPPLPPYDGDSDMDENADDNYSPICSDDEWLDNEETNGTQDEAELASRNRTLGGNREEEKDDENDSMQEEPDNFEDKYRDVEEEEERASTSNEETRERAAHSWTLALLSMLSHSNDPIDRLADPTTIQALAGYIASAKNYRASVILTRIIRNRAYFVSLLLQGFVFEAQTLYGTEQYTRALCDLAETGGAFGELATLLLRGQELQRFIVALSIPFLVKNREKLRVLLHNHGALDLIFRVLNEPDNSLYDEAILAICRLADSLYVAAPERTIERSNSRATTLSNIVAGYTTKDKQHSSRVTFELDDGSTVEASRASLCEKYEVFSAMLDGYFNESGKSRVRLKNASKEGLDTLLTAASGDSDVRRDRTIEAILDAVLLADQYLMFDVSEHLTETSIARLNHENLSRAWNWSRDNSCHELQACCVKIFLTASMTRYQRLQAFRDFSKTPSFHEFIKDIRQIIDDSLAITQI